MSTNKLVKHFGYMVLLFTTGCFSQTSQPTVVVTPIPATSSTPLPPPLPSALPYYNALKPIYPQQFVSGPQFIGGPNIPQRFFNGPSPYVGQFIPIIQQTFDITPEGSYTFGYQSADGTQRQESGGLKYPAVPGYSPVLSIQGSYSSITPEGVPIEVTYVADENGYQPSGPGIHPSIIRAVAQQVARAKQEQPQLIKK